MANAAMKVFILRVGLGKLICVKLSIHWQSWMFLLVLKEIIPLWLQVADIARGHGENMGEITFRKAGNALPGITVSLVEPFPDAR